MFLKTVVIKNTEFFCSMHQYLIANDYLLNKPKLYYKKGNKHQANNLMNITFFNKVIVQKITFTIFVDTFAIE